MPVWTRVLAVAAIAALLSGCRGQAATERYAREHATELVRESTQLWQNYRQQRSSPIPAADIPRVVAALQPKEISVHPEGVYITTHRRFVETAGLFVRLDRSFPVPASGDPRFTPVIGEIYWFFAPG